MTSSWCGMITGSRNHHAPVAFRYRSSSPVSRYWRLWWRPHTSTVSVLAPPTPRRRRSPAGSRCWSSTSSRKFKSRRSSAISLRSTALTVAIHLLSSSSYASVSSPTPRRQVNFDPEILTCVSKFFNKNSFTAQLSTGNIWSHAFYDLFYVTLHQSNWHWHCHLCHCRSLSINWIRNAGLLSKIAVI